MMEGVHPARGWEGAGDRDGDRDLGMVSQPGGANWDDAAGWLSVVGAVRQGHRVVGVGRDLS